MTLIDSLTYIRVIFNCTADIQQQQNSLNPFLAKKRVIKVSKVLSFNLFITFFYFSTPPFYRFFMIIFFFLIFILN